MFLLRLLGTCLVIGVASALTTSTTRLVAGGAAEHDDDELGAGADQLRSGDRGSAPKTVAFMNQARNRSEFAVALVPIALVIAFAHILGRVFEWDLHDLLTPFLWLPISSSIHWAGWLSLVLTLLFAVTRRIPARRAILATSALSIAFAADFFVPYTDIWLDLNYRTKLAYRNEIVQAVRKRELAPNVAHNARLIRLPPEPAVSKGGNEVVVQNYGEDPFVLFYTFRGVLSHYAGFLWVPATGNARDFDDLAQGALIRHKEGQWYYVSR